MNRKRKSESISGDDINNVYIAQHVNKKVSSILNTGNTESNANRTPLSNDRATTGKTDELQIELSIPDAMSRATQSFNESARLMQISQQSASEFNKRCTRCRYINLKCDLQRPICNVCQKYRSACSYAKDNHKYAQKPVTSNIPKAPQSPQQTEVEAVDLEPDADEKEYEVEAIIARRSSKKTGVEYQVKWKGWPHEDNTWEPVANLDGARALIDEYDARIASTLKPVRRKIGQPDLRRSPSLGSVVVPRNPRILEHQHSRPIPESVKSVKGCRLVPADDSYEYLVSWVGLAPNQSSWESEERFLLCKSLIRDYHLATCLDFASDHEVATKDKSGIDPELISAGTQVIVCSHRIGIARKLTYTVYDKVKETHFRAPASDLKSNELQIAMSLFVMRSMIMRVDFASHKTLELKRELDRYHVSSPLKEKETSSVPPVKITPEIGAVISHRLSTPENLEFLIRWKHSQMNTWHSSEILLGLPDGIMAMRQYVETMQKDFAQRIPPVPVSDSIPKIATQLILTAAQASGPKSMDNNVVRQQSASSSNDAISQTIPFFRRCTECKNAKVSCNGTARCERCVTMHLICVYPRPTYNEREAAEVWLKNQLSQHLLRALPEATPASRLSTAGQMPSTFSTKTAIQTVSEKVWRTKHDGPMQILDHRPPLGASFANNISSFQWPDQQDVVVPPSQMADRASPDKIRMDLKTLHGLKQLQGIAPAETSPQNETDEEWIYERVLQMLASLSDEQKRSIRNAYARGTRGVLEVAMNNKIDPLLMDLRFVATKEIQTWYSWNQYVSRSLAAKEKAEASRQMREGKGRGKQPDISPPIKPFKVFNLNKPPNDQQNSTGLKGREDKEMKGALKSSKKAYPAEDSYIVIRKTQNSHRPLPDGHRNRHNIASNVLLAIGKHPWLPGLNHHLKDLLDRSPTQRAINTASEQARNSEKFKNYRPPETQ